MKFFDLSLSGLSQMQYAFGGGQTRNSQCALHAYAGGTTLEECAKSDRKVLSKDGFLLHNVNVYTDRGNEVDLSPDYGKLFK